VTHQTVHSPWQQQISGERLKYQGPISQGYLKGIKKKEFRSHVHGVLNAARCTFFVYAPQKDACVAHVESLGGTAAQVYTHEQSRAFRNTRDHVVILIDPSGATEAPRWFEPDGPFQWLFGSTRDRAVVASVHQWNCTMK
jgi:hypothetical protein